MVVINKPSVIEIIDIVLLRSLLERQPYSGEPQSEPKINFEIGYNLPNKNLLEVVLDTKVEITGMQHKLLIDVKMLGMFRTVKNSNIQSYLKGLGGISLEQFVNVNAAAIIYPYVREHILELSVKARSKPVLLPVVNFMNLNKKNEV